MQYDNCIIIYKQNDLNHELNRIIELYGSIPKVKNHKYDIVNITFNHKNKNIHLYVDPNDDVICDYKYIKSECEKLNVPFKNQSFTQLIMQLKKRHYEQDNKEQGFLKCSETESSFNSITKSIFDSSLYGSYAFIESICNKIPKKMTNNKIYSIDINKCRKNILYYQNYNYPLFTVMDKPIEYKGQTGAGLYYVETAQYFPFRGFGWYSYPLIKYGLDNDLIKSEEIKYVVESSLEVPHDYFNKFIDYLYDNINEAKLSVNSMIGNFKPKPRESWKSQQC